MKAFAVTRTGLFAISTLEVRTPRVVASTSVLPECDGFGFFRSLSEIRSLPFLTSTFMLTSHSLFGFSDSKKLVELFYSCFAFFVSSAVSGHFARRG